MGGVARSDLVAAVSAAGGFGFLGMVRESANLILREAAAVRAKTTAPFGINLIPAATKPDLLRAELAACIEARPRCVSLFWDFDPDIVEALHSAGILVAWQVGTLEEALAAEAGGVDLIIAQGFEAGGHVRGETGLSALIPQVAGQVRAPVIAAGGIVDGAGLASALLLGAQGAMIGTGFLATTESFAHDYHKQRIVSARADETLHTTVFHRNWPPGAAVRVLPNSVTRKQRGDPFGAPREVIGREGLRPIYLFSTDSPLRSMTGDFEAMALYAGQGAGRIDDIVPAGERLRAILAEAETLLSPQGATDSWTVIPG